MDDVDIIGDYVGVIMYIVTGNKLGVNLWLYHFYGSPFATYYYPIRNDNGQGYLSRKGGRGGDEEELYGGGQCVLSMAS